MKHSIFHITIVVAFFAALTLHAQNTVFTYQGNLKQNGSAASGSYDFQFGLFTTASNGTATATVTNSGVTVSNGVFTTLIDFGNVFDGTTYWLDIAIRPNGSAGAFSNLVARQLITSTPYASFASSAGTVTGVLTVSNLPASVALLNSSPNFTGTVTASNFNGNGSGITNLTSSPTKTGYLFAYDTTTQAFPNSNVYLAINFSNPSAQLNGWQLSAIGPGSSTFTSSNSGLYFVQYTAEITGIAGRTASLKATLNNNIEIAGSQAAVTLITNTATTLSKNFMAQINSNDVFRLQFSSDNTGATPINLLPAGSGITRPSVSLTLIKIN